MGEESGNMGEDVKKPTTWLLLASSLLGVVIVILSLVSPELGLCTAEEMLWFYEGGASAAVVFTSVLFAHAFLAVKPSKVVMIVYYVLIGLGYLGAGITQIVNVSGDNNCTSYRNKYHTVQMVLSLLSLVICVFGVILLAIGKGD